MNPRFLTLEEVLEIHRDQITRYGGSAGVRDLGLLESALAMPRSGVGLQFLHEDVPAMAAAYLFHPVKNHHFVDGNKRVAAAATNVFLLLNGLHLEINEDEYVDLVLKVIAGTISKQQMSEYFRANTTPIR